MDLKLNDSEIMAILTMIDDYSSEGMESLVKTTLLSITNKINDNVQYKHHNLIDDYGIDVRSYLESLESE